MRSLVDEGRTPRKVYFVSLGCPKNQVDTEIMLGVVRDADPEVRAIIRRRPQVETAPPADFVARGGLELILHAHDIAEGIGFPFVPDADLCGRLQEHTSGWHLWGEMNLLKKRLQVEHYIQL